ncbi:33686_t:CDS:2, partial [Gigaspora margarita]
MSQRRFPHHTSTQDSVDFLGNSLDWFQAFPITKEVENQNQFPTPLGTQVLNFIKPFLQNFYPGQTASTEITNQYNSYQFPIIKSLKERTTASIKASLYHIYTCKENTCNILPNNTLHTLRNLTSFYFHNSFSNNIYPYLNFSIFQQNQPLAATFTKPFPLKSFKELAYTAEQKYIQLNNTISNPKRETFFYYTYFKYFFHTAIKNDNITDTNLKSALQNTFSKTTDPHTLAKIIAYFDIIQFSNTQISQIKLKYYQSYLPQAIQYITKKLQIPKISTDLFFPQFKIPDIP